MEPDFCPGKSPMNGGTGCVRDEEITNAVSRIGRVEREIRGIERSNTKEHMEFRAAIKSLVESQSRVEQGLLELVGAQNNLEMTQKEAMDAIEKLIGEPPDPSTGFKGSGIRGIVSAALNASIRGNVREELPSIIDLDEEGETTAVQSRDTIVARAKLAEFRERHAKRIFWVKLLVAAGGGAGVVELIKLFAKIAGGGD